METYLSPVWSLVMMADILCLSSSGRLSKSPKMFLSIFLNFQLENTENKKEKKRKTVTHRQRSKVLGFYFFKGFSLYVIDCQMPKALFSGNRKKKRSQCCLNPKTPC